MSISLYQIGNSGLLAAQQQLATTSHNIANVDTDGYSRQRAEQGTNNAIQSGRNFLGTGSYVKDIARLYDQFSYKEQVNSQTSLGQADTKHLGLNQLNEVMTFSSAGILTSMQGFYQSINSINDNPDDLGLRNIALQQAENLTVNVNSLNENFDQMSQTVNGEIGRMAAKITEISQGIASINQIMTQKMSSGGGQANDLLDERDRLVNQLAEFTTVNTIADSRGIMSVMIGQGTTLVAGTTALSVQVIAGDPDPLQAQLQLSGPNSTMAIDSTKLGGALAAKIEFRDQDLAQARRELDVMVLAISETINDVQADGLDLNAAQGTDLFTDINSVAAQQGRIFNQSSNGGNLTAQINISDVSALSADEFEVRYDGANYTMTNLRDNSITNLGPSVAGSTHTTTLGFDFVESAGGPIAGDRYIIRPGQNSAANMAVQLSDGNGIAASSAVEITPSDNNISPGKVEISDMVNPVTARTMMPMRVEVLETAPNVFNYVTIDNTGTASAAVAYTPPSQEINMGAFSFTISGRPSGTAPSAPEQFFIGDSYGVGNGGNALALAATQELGVVNGGKQTFNQSLASNNADVGSKASQAKNTAETSQALFTQAFNRNQATSGVNLDEEAANLMKFQQAYQAAAKVMTVASTLFDSILSLSR